MFATKRPTGASTTASSREGGHGGKPEPDGSSNPSSAFWRYSTVYFAYDKYKGVGKQHNTQKPVAVKV